MKIEAILLTFLFSIACPTKNGNQKEIKQWTSLEVKRVLVALQKAFSFYEQNGDTLNLDAYFGLRIAQGILSSLIHQKDNKTSLRLGSAVYIQVNDLLDRAANCSSNAQITLRESSPQYYNLVGLAVSQPWRTVRRHNTINPNLVTGFNEEQLSDDILWKYESCLARLLGSPVHGGKPCVITAECWGLMTRPGEIGYVLTHQALYFMLGEQRGCFKALPNEVTIPKLQETYDRICSNIYNQLVVIEEQIHPTKRIDADLMMEQCVVCGLMGYNEFLTPQRLRRVLKWQRSSGCYGDINDETNLTRQGKSRKTMRKLLTTKDLPDGCESHITGVGTALLSIYLRFLLEDESHFQHL